MERRPPAHMLGRAMTQTSSSAVSTSTEAGTTVMTAAKAAAERAGAPLLLTHVSTSLWGTDSPGVPGRRRRRPARRARPARPAAPGRRRRPRGRADRPRHARQRWRSVARHVAARARAP